MENDYTKTKLPSFKRFMELIRLEKKDISAIYFFAILGSLVQLSLPLGFQAIVGFVQGGMVSTSLVLLVSFVVVGVFLNGWLQVNQMKVIEKIQQQLFVRYAFQYAHSIPRLQLKPLDKYYLPELVNRFFDTVSLQKGLSKILLDIPAALLQILFGMLLLSLYHPMFMVLGLLLLLLIFMIIRVTAQKGLSTSVEESNHKYAVAGWLEELARGLLSFKMLGRLSFPLKQTDKRVGAYLESRTSHFKVLVLQYWVLVFFKVVITATLVIMGVVLLINQQLNIGQFVAAEIVVLLLISSVEKLIGYMDKIYDVLTSLEKLSKLSEMPLENEEQRSKVSTAKTLHWKIEARKISFGHDGKPSLFNNISFAVEKGSLLGIKGSNGSGKSSLLKILAGLYQPIDGALLLNGLSLNSYDAFEFRSHVGFCFENPELVEGSLRDNVLMGRLDVKEERLRRLSDELGLESMLETMPNNWDYQVQAAGKALPKKMKSKIMLLRAVIHAPELVLLDEPWQGLDEASQTQIKQFIHRHSSDCMMVVATNDSKFLGQCQQVVDLDGF